MINFVNTGADEAILKSMPTEGCSEDLIKAMNKQGLVQKDVTVQGKNGTFTRKQWVKASEAGKSKSTGTDKKSNKPVRKASNSNDLVNGIHHINRTIRDELNIYHSVGITEAKRGMAKVFVSVPKLGGDKDKALKMVKKYIEKEFGNSCSIVSVKDWSSDDLSLTLEVSSDKDSKLDDTSSQNSNKLSNKKTKKVTSKDFSNDFKSLEEITGVKVYDMHTFKGGTQLLFGRSADKNGKQSLNFVESNKVKDNHKKIVEYLKSNGFTVVSEDNYKPKDSYLKSTPIATGLQLSITHMKDSKGSDLYVKSRVGGWSEKQFVSVSTESDKVNTDEVWDKQGDKSIQQSSTGQKLSPADAKKKTQEVTKGVSDKKSFMEKAKAQGITWKENDHEGINWMRCCMAMNKHFENGGTFDNSVNNSSTTGSSKANASNSKTGSTEPIKSTKNNDSVKTSGLKSNEVCDNIIETCDDLYGDGFVFLDRKEQDEVIQKVADNFGVNSKDIDKMLRSGLDAGGYLLTRNGAELSDEKVFDAVHDYIGNLTVQEIDDVDEVVDYIRENYTDYVPLTSETFKSVKSAVKKILG